MPETLFDKFWNRHEVAPGLLYIDLHLVHEVTSPQAFDGLRLAGRRVRRPDRTLATADHNVPTDGTPVAERIKDELSLATIGQIGVAGAVGHVVEFAGPAIEALSMEGRMTVCNMTIEGGGRAGMIAPDETTFQWVTSRPGGPDEVPLEWRELKTDG